MEGDVDAHNGYRSGTTFESNGLGAVGTLGDVGADEGEEGGGI